MRIAVCFLLFSSLIRYMYTKNTKKKFDSNYPSRASLSGVGASAALAVSLQICDARQRGQQPARRQQPAASREANGKTGREASKGNAFARIIMYARGKM